MPRVTKVLTPVSYTDEYLAAIWEELKMLNDRLNDDGDIRPSRSPRGHGESETPDDETPNLPDEPEDVKEPTPHTPKSRRRKASV